MRTKTGFTLVEILVVVIVIGILASIALPNLVGAQKKAALASVRENMHTVQVAAEAYAADAGGLYASSVSSIAPYFPGGSNAAGGTNGSYPENPITGVSNETPAASPVTTSATLLTMRSTTAPTSASPLSRGQTGYAVILDRNGANTSYSVVGADASANLVMSASGGIMVLSNQ